MEFWARKWWNSWKMIHFLILLIFLKFSTSLSSMGGLPGHSAGGLIAFKWPGRPPAPKNSCRCHWLEHTSEILYHILALDQLNLSIFKQGLQYSNINDIFIKTRHLNIKTLSESRMILNGFARTQANLTKLMHVFLILCLEGLIVFFSILVEIERELPTFSIIQRPFWKGTSLFKDPAEAHGFEEKFYLSCFLIIIFIISIIQCRLGNSTSMC